ncbi:MAG: cytochrome c maturation protein CcmE [Candidatus Aquicultor sp.]
MVDSKSKTRLLIVTGILLVVIGVMIWQSLGSGASVSYYKAIAEVTRDSSFVGKNINVGGQVKEGSVVTKGHTCTFTIFDQNNKNLEMTVEYSKQLPSTFGPGINVVAEGKLLSKGKIVANSVITKCPSKYDKEKKPGGK